MIIGSIKERDPKETRISLTPDIVKKLTIKGHNVFIEKSYGINLGFSDTAYLNSGAKIINTTTKIYQKSEILLFITPPQTNKTDVFKHCKLIIADFTNYPKDSLIQNTRILCLEQVPRISVAQSIDILSSQSIVRGYMSAIYALYHSNRIAPEMMTAATTIKPLQALIIGASTTGLQAAITLKKAGCHVMLMDINAKAEELAHSVGASFTLQPNKKDLPEYLSTQNIIISTASNNQEIISSADIKKLKPFTILIDTTLKNINLTTPIPPNIHFYRNHHFEHLAPITASELWANNILNLLNIILPTPNTLDLTATYIKPMIKENT